MKHHSIHENIKNKSMDTCMGYMTGIIVIIIIYSMFYRICGTAFIYGSI